MSLPDGTVIDLNFSGMDPTPINVSATTITGVTEAPFHARTVSTDLTTAGGNSNDCALSHYYGTSVLGTGIDSQPIMITFRSTGLVGMVYQRRPMPDIHSHIYQWR